MQIQIGNRMVEFHESDAEAARRLCSEIQAEQGCSRDEAWDIIDRRARTARRAAAMADAASTRLTIAAKARVYAQAMARELIAAGVPADAAVELASKCAAAKARRDGSGPSIVGLADTIEKSLGDREQAFALAERIMGLNPSARRAAMADVGGSYKPNFKPAAAPIIKPLATSEAAKPVKQPEPAFPPSLPKKIDLERDDAFLDAVRRALKLDRMKRLPEVAAHLRQLNDDDPDGEHLDALADAVGVPRDKALDHVRGRLSRMSWRR